MNTFKLRVFYEYHGRTHSDPFASQKSPNQVRDALNNVGIRLSHQLANADVQTEPTDAMLGDNSILVTVTTDKSKQVFDAVLKECLQKLRLFAEYDPRS
jgi:hypothetical protein